ncbi:Hpt domain-containing protein [Arthrobacter sp. Sa2CUA1]|uniref:Hpt domain-containing protein n=1 Tax=Arthrobacter gallicola TaxID=2762225 RepID=A0ABR8UVF0_9MICC|nr:Hpt domain-containing protein [Arthrobacter gallicola]MBD7996061.1 Hpt domain-containing protein [Arthrobacter gallicola]
MSTRALRDLSDQLGLGTCQQFVGNYITMWESRYSRLVAALHSEDFPDVMDVVLSIKISSQMAGAERLAGLAAEAQQLAHSRDHAGLMSLLEPLQRCGEDTIRQLHDTLPRL